jgi:Nif-specific regulatory protein
MAAELIAVDGPATGLVRRLESGGLLIGRDPSNSLCIEDGTVSRRHCTIRPCDGGWTLTDQETRNGTFVNGVPVRERKLANRDEIQIGASRFLLLMEPEAADVDQEQASDDACFATRSIALSPKQPQLLDVERSPVLMALGERHGRGLGAILRICTGVAALRDIASIGRCLFENIHGATAAARGSILLVNEESGEMQSAYAWNRVGGEGKAPALPAAELKRAVTEGCALLIEVEGSQSTSLVAPLMAGGRAFGVIAVESPGGSAAFDSGHLEWLCAVAAIASPPFENLRHVEWLEAENRRLTAEINIQHNMVGESAAIREVMRQIAKAAPAESTVLIRGETGTGKELVARAIHSGSRRSARPFVAVNCATLSESLLESDLFGHEKGAFTGAIAQKRGKIEMAEGGTLFLDEVGELAPQLQAKMLRVLQEREFERVGGLRPIRADIRLIAATNRNLEEAAKRGAFRTDLYYRLNVISITAPPLRDRREDIALLASYFLSRHARETPRRIAGISPRARAALAAHDWPGNVRELENAIERAAVLGSTDLILVEDLPETIVESTLSGNCGSSRYHEAVAESKRRLILMAIEEARGSHQEAAKSLGINPTYLSRLIRNLDLKSAAGSATG